MLRSPCQRPVALNLKALSWLTLGPLRSILRSSRELRTSRRRRPLMGGEFRLGFSCQEDAPKAPLFCRRSHASIVVSGMSEEDIDAFVRGWRQHFLDSMCPRFMPPHWSVNSRVRNGSASKAQGTTTKCPSQAPAKECSTIPMQEFPHNRDPFR